MLSLESIEKQRVRLQDTLDDRKSQLERNKLGQFATPASLARDIIQYAAKISRRERVRFLDPAIGTGSFYSALLSEFNEVESALGYEIDQNYASGARKLWAGTGLNIIVRDFTRATPDDASKANLVICNPPYVRHHHLTSSQKRYLQKQVEKETGIRLSGLSGFYCYYILLTGKWMEKDALAGWLIPSEFMDVNYGRGLKKYLTERVTLLRIHRFDPEDVQFSDAYVSSVVLFFRNTPPRNDNAVEITYSGSLSNPRRTRLVHLNQLRNTVKWAPLFLENRLSSPSGETTLGSIFRIKRGLATGSNEFFILNEEQAKDIGIPAKFLKPILPMPRQLKEDKIEADSEGNPTITPRLFLISCDLTENEVKSSYPSLWRYLQRGIEQKINQRYLCKHRTPWYSQEHRPPAPYLCSYMGRSGKQRATPFRFILNHSKATASNSYLVLYPTPNIENLLRSRPELREAIWKGLQSIPSDALICNGRVYGGGLHKLEPKELANLPIASSLLSILSIRSDKA
jgi:adenine-specific DNA-methyltransferase